MFQKSDLSIQDKLTSYSKVTKSNYKWNSPLDIGEVYQARPYYNWIVDSVGQLVEIGERGEIKDRFCSGFNIGQGYFLTAGHCLTDNNVCYAFDESFDPRNIVVNFGYSHNSPFVQKYSRIKVEDHGSCNIDVLSPIEFESINGRSATTDYAVFSLEPGMISATKSLNISRTIPPSGSDIVLAHYPAGTHEKISFGEIKYANNKAVNHTAFTLGGSSGCPIALDDGSQKVVAVHVAGSIDNRKIPDQKDHYGVTFKEITRIAKDNDKAWVYNLGLFQRPNNTISVNNDERQLIPYYTPQSTCKC